MTEKDDGDSVGIVRFMGKIRTVTLWTYLLTYSMVQSLSWEANWFAASQEIPRISRNPKVYYRTHKRPPPVSILGQPDPVHITTSHLLEIHPNIIHPPTPRSPQWSLSLRFPHQEPIHALSSPTRATCPAHLILLDFITRTILDEEYLWTTNQNICRLTLLPSMFRQSTECYKKSLLKCLVVVLSACPQTLIISRYAFSFLNHLPYHLIIQS